MINFKSKIIIITIKQHDDHDYDEQLAGISPENGLSSGGFLPLLRNESKF